MTADSGRSKRLLLLRDVFEDTSDLVRGWLESAIEKVDK